MAEDPLMTRTIHIPRLSLDITARGCDDLRSLSNTLSRTFLGRSNEKLLVSPRSVSSSTLCVLIGMIAFRMYKALDRSCVNGRKSDRQSCKTHFARILSCASTMIPSLLMIVYHALAKGPARSCKPIVRFSSFIPHLEHKLIESSVFDTRSVGL